MATNKKSDAQPTEPKQATPAASDSYAQKDLVTKVEKNSYGDELNITLADGFKAEDVLKNTKEVVINGKTTKFKGDSRHKCLIYQIVQQ